MPQAIADYNATHDLALWSHASAEAQVAAIADDIAYDAHDLDDGLRADLFALDDLADVPVIGGLMREVRDDYPGIDPARLTHELVRRLIGRLIEDVVTREPAAHLRRRRRPRPTRCARRAARWSASPP